MDNSELEERLKLALQEDQCSIIVGGRRPHLSVFSDEADDAAFETHLRHVAAEDQSPIVAAGRRPSPSAFRSSTENAGADLADAVPMPAIKGKPAKLER